MDGAVARKERMMKQSKTIGVIVWIWQAVFLLAAGTLIAGGVVMFVLGLLGQLN